METQTMKATNLKLKEFFVHQLKDIYWAEKELFKTIAQTTGSSHNTRAEGCLWPTPPANTKPR